jgi:hypothetical protein
MDSIEAGRCQNPGLTIPDDIATEVTNNVQFIRRIAPNLEGLYFEAEDSFSFEHRHEFFSMMGVEESQSSSFMAMLKRKGIFSLRQYS